MAENIFDTKYRDKTTTKPLLVVAKCRLKKLDNKSKTRNIEHIAVLLRCIAGYVLFLFVCLFVFVL